MPQRPFLLLISLSISNLLLGQTDTLNSFFNVEEATITASPNGGYVSGTNGYGDKEKLQVFLPDGNYSVLGAFVWIAKKEVLSSGGAESALSLKMRRFDATPTQTIPFYAGPKEVLDSVSVPLSQLQAGVTLAEGINYISFSNPVFAGQPYGMSVSFENILPEDTLAVMHSAIDSVLAEGQSWEIWNGNWRRIIDNWGLNIDFAIFPVIDSTLNATENITNLGFAAYPNPSSNFITLKIDQDVSASSFVYEIIDLKGCTIQKQLVMNPINSTAIDVAELKNGAYMLKVIADHKVGVQPIIIMK
jgi:hypothetical protein